MADLQTSDFSLLSDQFNFNLRTTPKNQAEDDPSFGAVAANVIGERLDPLVSAIGRRMEFGGMEIDPNFDFRDHVEGYEIYAKDLATSRSLIELNERKELIDRSLERRQEMSRASGGKNFLAGLVDPINVVAIPFGGPALTVGRAVLKGAASVAAVEAVAGAANVALNPVATPEEEVVNFAMSAVFGGAIGGAARKLYGPPSVGDTPASPVNRDTSRLTPVLKETEKVQRDMSAVADRAANLRGLSSEEVRNRLPREQRPLAEVSTEELRARIDRVDDTTGAKIDVNDAQIEVGFRQIDELEENGGSVTTPEGGFNYKASWFTDSIFFKAIPTPMKRMFQGDYSDKVKEIFARSYSDNGVTMAMNSVGRESPQSVAVRTAVHQGRWVQASDEMFQAFAKDTNASTARVAGVSLTNLARTVTRKDNTYRNWLDEISVRRIKGDTSGMTEAQNTALRVMDDYFVKSQARLEDTGLLMNQKGMSQRIRMLEQEIDTLKRSSGPRATRGNANQMIEDRINDLTRRMKGMQKMLASAPDGQTDAFFPRFYDLSAIRKNRSEFERILTQHFTDNPFINGVNKRGVPVRTRLSTHPDKIKERVDQTIANILGEKDPLNVDSINFGAGRSKHFRQRQLDIPNSQITDFMMTDPLAVMKTYAARVEPRYEYAKQFGKDVDGVRFDLERELIEDGHTQKEINAVMRDFNHMYDRVIGTVLEKPDALNQKVATFLREAASFSYMGGSGLAALPDFGRIVMEYDMRNVVRGMQAVMDKTRVNLNAREGRIAGEILDIEKGSAHMRLQEDLSNNIDQNGLLAGARNTFFTLNGLGPMTVMAKTLAGTIDAHQIVEYSVKLGDGTLDDQGIEWLARYGIGREMAAKIAKAPHERTENGFYMANTEAWASDDYLNTLLDQSFKYRHPTARFSAMTDTQLTSHFNKQFPEANVITDPSIVGPYFEKIKKETGYRSLLGFMTDTRDIPDAGFTVHIDKAEVRNRYDKVKNNAENADQVRADAQQAFDDGKISEEFLFHVRNELDAIDMFETPDDYFEYILLHELHHSSVQREVGESIASLENRVDQAAIAYMRKPREAGKELARDQAMASLRSEQEEVVMQFRAALNSNIMNTIMAGTPADKPIITDGVAYIPMSVAGKFGMKEHPKFKGYARIENGLMGLPFQFYSFALANVNKTVGALAQGQVRNRVAGSAAMMGLAYMTVQVRTPEYIWNEMSVQDKFARTFDMSGIMALYSDLFYTSMHTSLALGGPNISNGILSPKFNKEGSVADGLTGLSGAGPSWGYTMAKGVVKVANGETGEGASDILRNMPFSNLWFWKDQVNQMARAIRE